MTRFKMFEECMNEAVDLAELIFNSEKEKKDFIKKAWKDYRDDILKNINEKCKNFVNLNKDYQIEFMKSSIAENSKAIFGKNIFE